jgi:SAM-dependent methyltransferase
MSHPQQQDFVDRICQSFPAFFSGTRVLEIGSLDINGSVRRHFGGCEYIGLDVGPGPGVDVVCPGQEYDAPNGSFDVVVSCECFEHNRYWRETFTNMVRLCRPGGLILMTCATTGRNEHGTIRANPADSPLIPTDYYGNLEAKDFPDSLSLAKHLSQWEFYSDHSSHDLYFVGFRKGAPAPADAVQELFKHYQHYLEKARSI